uniref:Uncharacterized protein n=1 Tax=viral metagenome TaxID=1070528 RepID=A0A6C0B7W8_9ZZZZ
MSDSNTYPYSKYILQPELLGASPKAGINPLKNDVKALISYVEVLTSGRSNAQSINPLGNRYFMDTGGKCKDSAGVKQTRYVYINNIPDGNIPFISSAMGQNMTSFEGLVPGVLGNIAYINPAKLFKAFDKESPCQKIKMPIRDINNNQTVEEKHVCESDIKEYNPCWFYNRVNPVTGVPCRSGMTTRTIPDDKMVQVYAASIYLLGAYLLFRLVQK